MAFYILIIALVILACLSLSKVSAKLGLPTLLVFIFLGMLFGSDGIVKIPFDNYTFAEQICSVALIFIMFYGGFGTNWKQGKSVAAKAILLSSLGVVMTAGLVGVFCYYVLKFDLLESMLMGSVISSTDAASVFSVLRSKRLNMKYNTASMLEIESGSNDPCSNILTVITLSLMSGQSSGWKLTYMVFAQIVYGIIIGIAVAYAAYFVLKRMKNFADGHDSILVFAVALISYAGAAVVDGNGYLSVYITGIILGNLPIGNKKSLVHFFDGVTGLVEIVIFFLLGLLSFPSQLPSIMLPSLLIALFLTFVARPVSVFAILSPFRCPINQQMIVAWSGLRGAASIVFAIMATVSSAYMKNDVFHVVFFIVLFSILFQGSLLPFMAKRMKMIDDKSDVMKTFSDYTEEVPIQFIKQLITFEHPWVNKKIRDIELLPDVLVVLIIREHRQIIPKGNIVLMAGDTVVLSGPSLNGDALGSLTEIRIEKDNEWFGKALSEIKFGQDRLVVVIKRNNKILIPRGRTVIREDDVLIINQTPPHVQV